MTAIGAAPRATLQQLIRRVSLAGHGSLAALLAQVCNAVTEDLAFDRVSGARYHAQAVEVSEIALAGADSGERGERRAITSVPLLAEALETQNLVLVSDYSAGEVTSSFALPLISGERCLGFLSGHRCGAVPPDEAAVEALELVGVVVAALLENALAREEAQRRDVLKSEFIALAAHEAAQPVVEHLRDLCHAGRAR